MWLHMGSIWDRMWFAPDTPYGYQMGMAIWGADGIHMGSPYGMYICVQYNCQKVVSVRYLFSIIMCSICIQYDSICVPYGIHMVYILVTHMECTDVYHMEDLYGAHVVSI